MNGDHITAEVIILMVTTALMETDRVARVRMITVMAVTTNRITAIMVETVAMATLIVKAAITADLLTVAIALMVTTIALLTAMTVLMGNDRPYNRPSRPNYEDRGKAYSATPSGEGVSGDGVKKRRPRVGDTRVSSSYDNRDNRGGRPSYGNNNNRYGNGGGRGGYNNNRRPNNNRRTGDYNPNAKYNFQKQLKYKEVLADPNEPIRLNKFLSNAGVCSRREADEFIQEGVVQVNGQVVTELGTKITRQDTVLFKDQPVQIESKVYIVLNKPKNCVTTSDDPQERLTVMDLVKNACQERIYPVGRLDRNTTGVLLLTNDGDLASKLTHPSFKKRRKSTMYGWIRTYLSKIWKRSLTD